MDTVHVRRLEMYVGGFSSMSHMSVCVVHTCAVHAHMCMYRDDCCGQLSSCIPLCLVC